MQRMPDLDDALQDLSVAVARRLVIIDASMRVVGYSIHDDEDDRQRLSHILTHSDSWPAPHAASRGHSIERVTDLGDCLFLPLTDRAHRVLGYLFVALADGGPPTEDELSTLNGGLERLGALLEVRNLHSERDQERSRALTVALITGSPESRTEAADALVAEHILSASGRYCAVAVGIDPRASEPSEVVKPGLAVALTLDLVAATSTASVVGTPLDDGTGVLVFPRPVVVPRLTGILQQPPIAGVRAGIGPLLALEEAHHSFERARLALRASHLAPRDHPIVLDWAQAGLDGLLARLPVEEFTVDDLPTAARELLVEGVDLTLLTTLDQYLAHGGDAQQAARAANIHRSTLYYRLDKVRAVLDTDLRDGLVRRELHTGLRIAQLARLGPWAP